VPRSAKSTNASTNASTNPGDDSPKLLCGKCRTAGLTRRTTRLVHLLTSFYPYKCDRCGHRQKKFRLTPAILIPAILLGATFVAGNLIRARLMRASESAVGQQGQREALARARMAAGGQLSDFEKLMVQKSKQTMDNAAVVRMVKANMSQDVILEMIQTSVPDYDLSASSVIEMKAAGVDQTIMLAMINASNAKR